MLCFTKQNQFELNTIHYYYADFKMNASSLIDVLI